MPQRRARPGVGRQIPLMESIRWPREEPLDGGGPGRQRVTTPGSTKVLLVMTNPECQVISRTTHL